MNLCVQEANRASPDILKKAVACLTSLYRHNKDLVHGAHWAERMNDMILHRTTGMTLSACSLLLLGLEIEGPEPYE